MEKCGILCPKTLLLTEKQLHTIHFLVVTRNVCPLAIPEPCAQNMGLRLLENHSSITCWPHRSKVRDSTPPEGDLSPLFSVVLICLILLFLNIFSFFDRLKIYSRLIIAGSLSPFISKIISPQVSHGHPLILATESLFKMAETTKFILTVLWQKVNWRTVTGFRYF